MGRGRPRRVPGLTEDRPPGRRPALRLAALLVLAASAFAVFAIFDVLDAEDVRGLLDPLGPFAAPAYVVVAAALALALVPGPILAGTSGLLFGAALGTAVTLCSAVLTAVLGVLLARRAAADDVEAVSGERLTAIASVARRHAFEAVVVARLAPGIPDTPVTYLFGAMRLAVAPVALGTLLGAAPRAFSYTAIGATLDDPGSPLQLAGIIGVVVTAIVGAAVARRFFTARRG